jgi:hypothetical protein
MAWYLVKHLDNFTLQTFKPAHVVYYNKMQFRSWVIVRCSYADVYTRILLESKFLTAYNYTRAVWEVRGLTLLLRVGTLWRCGDGLFFVVPPLASDALLTTLHPLLENVLQTVSRKLQEDSGTGTVLGLPLRGSNFTCVSASLKRFHHLKPQLVSLHRLHRLDGWVVGFLIHFFRAEHRIQSRNAVAPPSKKRVLLKQP